MAGPENTSFRSIVRGVRWTPTLGVSIAALVVAGLVIAAGLPSLTTAVITKGHDENARSAVDELLGEHSDALALAEKRFNQRSVFFMPPAPKPKPPPPPPAPPATYTGKKVNFLLGQTVYFVDGSRARVGDETDGVRILEVKAPWEVRLHHLGRDYDHVLLDFKSSADLFKPLAESTGLPAGLLPSDKVDQALAKIKSSGAAPPPAAPSGRGAAPRGREDPAEAARAEAAGEGDAATEKSDAPPEGEADAAPVSAAPAILSKAEIDQLDRSGAMKALSEVVKAKNKKDLDEATKAALDEQYKLLLARVREAASTRK